MSRSIIFLKPVPGAARNWMRRWLNGHTARQVFDLARTPAANRDRTSRPRLSVHGVQARRHEPPFPKTWTPRRSNTARASRLSWSICCTYQLLLPEKRLAALMADLLEVNLGTATIAGMSRACATRFQGFVAAVRDQVAAAPVKVIAMDETGFRIGGKTQWLHIASTIWLTFYRVSPKRGSLLENVLGIVVHDHWKPYYTLKGVLHALCNAHHLRELQAAGRDRERGLGAQDATPVAPGRCHADESRT